MLVLIQNFLQRIQHLHDLLEICHTPDLLVVLVDELKNSHGLSSVVVESTDQRDDGIGVHELHIDQVLDTIIIANNHELHLFDVRDAFKATLRNRTS